MPPSPTPGRGAPRTGRNRSRCRVAVEERRAIDDAARGDKGADHFADDNVSMALISNGTNFDNNQISIALLNAIYNKPYKIPTFKTFEIVIEDLDKYLGVYASKQIPLRITITKNSKTLIAQATGQPSFALEATEKDKFKFDQAGVVLEFISADKTMILRQGGGIFHFTRE